MNNSHLIYICDSEKIVKSINVTRDQNAEQVFEEICKEQGVKYTSNHVRLDNGGSIHLLEINSKINQHANILKYCWINTNNGDNTIVDDKLFSSTQEAIVYAIVCLNEKSKTVYEMLAYWRLATVKLNVMANMAGAPNL